MVQYLLTNVDNKDKLKGPYIFKENNDEIRSHAMEIYEPCQVGNKAALSGIFHVP